ERLDFARVIQEKEWHIKALDAESESGMIRARSLDIEVTEPTEKRSGQMVARSGEFSQDTSKLWLKEISGTIFLDGKSIDIAAPRADYDVSSDVWYFSEGLAMSDDRAFVSGRSAKIDASGVLTMGKGVLAHWIVK
ncbi:MAG: hypothetical protein LBQ36_09355, partial [Synergistaceae bacterium]|nr:hypothetical protein [Synergistaceae bacterium]